MIYNLLKYIYTETITTNIFKVFQFNFLKYSKMLFSN